IKLHCEIVSGFILFLLLVLSKVNLLLVISKDEFYDIQCTCIFPENPLFCIHKLDL
uniref:Uncharacterized protein n=1 Tax=Amphimedon queenslandica TaxID=400682 RepID=A0A1X7VIN7_AMPQE